MPPRRLPGNGRHRPAPIVWDLNLAVESLKAPMPSRTDPKHAAVIRNIEKYPALATLDARPDEQTLVRTRVSTQLIPSPHKNRLMSSDYDGSHDQFSAGGRRITKCAMPITSVRDDNEKEIHRPSFDKIHAARESKKTWASLGLDPNLVTALRNIGYKRPLPVQRVAISGVQEGISTFIAGSSGCAKTTAALIASIDLVMKNLSKMPQPHEVVHRSCAPIVVKVVPSHDLAESAFADIVSFMVKSDAGLDNYVKPVTVHGSINRHKNIELLRSDANIVIGTPGRLADMIENHLISSANLRLLVFDQAFALGNGSFRHAMHCIEDWVKGPSADSSVKTWSHPTVLAPPDAVGPHRNTNVLEYPAPPGFKAELVNPKPRAQVPCMVLSQVLDLTEPRDAALHQHFMKTFMTSEPAMTIRFHQNPLQDFHGKVDVHQVRRTTQKRGKKLLEDFLEMTGPENKKVLSVAFDRNKVGVYDSLLHQAGVHSEILMSGDKGKTWSRDAFSCSNPSHLITTSIGAKGNNWRDLDNLIVVNIPSEKLVAFEGEKEGVVNSYKGVFHYLVEAVGRLGREGRVKIYYDPKTEEHARADLVKLLNFTRMPVPDFLKDAFPAPTAADPNTFIYDPNAITNDQDASGNDTVVPEPVMEPTAVEPAVTTVEPAMEPIIEGAVEPTTAEFWATVPTQLTQEQLKQLFLERLRHNQRRSRSMIKEARNKQN